MAKIEKKTWPDAFRRIKAGTKNVEVRLADFKVKRGDVLVLREWDPKTKRYTGKVLSKTASAVRWFDIYDYYSPKEIKKYGLYQIELKK